MVELMLGIFDSLELRIVFSCIRPSLLACIGLF